MTDPAGPAPGGYRFNDEAFAAALDLVGRVGAKEFALGHIEDGVPVEQARWYAHVQYRGARITAEEHVGPVEAVEALVARLVHGAVCIACDRLTVINDDPIPIGAVRADGQPVDVEAMQRRGACRWTRNGRRWERGCGNPAPAGSTREKLARALIDAGAPSQAVRNARDGYWDPWCGELPFPIATLVADLEANGLHELAGRARNGEFDGTREEADAWAASAEGQRTFTELGDSVAAGAARAAAAGAGGRRPWRANRRTGKNRRR